MKIKVVDMTYEQALAQPPQVHKKPKNRRSCSGRSCAQPPRPTFWRRISAARRSAWRRSKAMSCLVLMNHSCFLDLKIAEAVLYPRPFNIVCTSDGFVGKEWLMRSVGCIPHAQVLLGHDARARYALLRADAQNVCAALPRGELQLRRHGHTAAGEHWQVSQGTECAGRDDPHLRRVRA